MGADCRHHRGCARIYRPPILPHLVQTTLTTDHGILYISHSPANIEPCRHCRQRYRTPLPHAVARITRAPTFATTDPSLTTFIRLPPEVRIEVYRLLLRYDGIIKYHICPVHARLIYRTWKRNFKPKLPWIRHGLFPAILECCRKLHREGRDVLYGENWFRIEYWAECDAPVLNSWDLGAQGPQGQSQQGNLAAIRKLSLKYKMGGECTQDRKGVEQMTLLLPGIRDLKVNVTSPKEWKALLTDADAMRCLRRMRKVVMEIDIADVMKTPIWMTRYPHVEDSGPTLGEACWYVYKPMILTQKSLVQNWGTVRWEFDECNDDIGRAYGHVLGDLRVILE